MRWSDTPLVRYDAAELGKRYGTAAVCLIILRVTKVAWLRCGYFTYCRQSSWGASSMVVSSW